MASHSLMTNIWNVLFSRLSADPAWSDLMTKLFDSATEAAKCVQIIFEKTTEAEPIIIIFDEAHKFFRAEDNDAWDYLLKSSPAHVKMIFAATRTTGIVGESPVGSYDFPTFGKEDLMLSRQKCMEFLANLSLWVSDAEDSALQDTDFHSALFVYMAGHLGPMVATMSEATRRIRAGADATTTVSDFIAQLQEDHFNADLYERDFGVVRE